MNLLEKVWDFIHNIIPVERWVRVIGNALKWLSLAFILLFALVMLLVMKGWGFTPEQRMSLIHWILILMGVVLVLGILLALLPGGLLYSPYERSLRHGKRYGTEAKPLSRNKASKILDQLPLPLPPGEENQETKKKLP